jgi:hypothetical protein
MMTFDYNEVKPRVEHFLRMGYSADKAALWLNSEFHEEYFAAGNKLNVKYMDEKKTERTICLGVL